MEGEVVPPNGYQQRRKVVLILFFRGGGKHPFVGDAHGVDDVWLYVGDDCVQARRGFRQGEGTQPMSNGEANGQGRGTPDWGSLLAG